MYSTLANYCQLFSMGCYSAVPRIILLLLLSFLYNYITLYLLLSYVEDIQMTYSCGRVNEEMIPPDVGMLKNWHSNKKGLARWNASNNTFKWRDKVREGNTYTTATQRFRIPVTFSLLFSL